MVVIDEPLISVIIPFYNIEKYAGYCMESLMLQEYRNCEFICVNDGSTDNTLNVLKKYEHDKRVRIFSKQNGGLSEARNYGLDMATGDYVTFIDGDDYVHPQYLKYLIVASEGRTSTMVIGAFRTVRFCKELDIQSGWSSHISYYKLNRKELSKKILYDEVSISAGGKLVSRSIYDNLRFPVGKVSEEVSTIGELIRQYENFSIINEPVYGYVMRTGSIGHKNVYKYKDIQDRIDAMNSLDAFIKSNTEYDKDNSMQKALRYRWGLRFIGLISMLDKVVDDKETAANEKRKVGKWFHENINQILLDSRAPLLQRLRMVICTYFPQFYLLIYSLQQKIKYNV